MQYKRKHTGDREPRVVDERVEENENWTGMEGYEWTDTWYKQQQGPFLMSNSSVHEASDYGEPCIDVRTCPQNVPDSWQTEELLAEFDDLLAIQCADWNWDVDPYMHGMANGMILMRSLVSGEKPGFLEAPDEWRNGGEDVATTTAGFQDGIRLGQTIIGEVPEGTVLEYKGQRFVATAGIDKRNTPCHCGSTSHGGSTMTRHANADDAVQALVANRGNLRRTQWQDLLELLQQMGWTVEAKNSFWRDDAFTPVDAEGNLTYNIDRDSPVHSLLHSLPYAEGPQAVGAVLASYMDAPKFKKKQPKGEWKDYYDEPDPTYVGATSKPPTDPIPGQMYLTQFSLDRDSELKRDEDGNLLYGQRERKTDGSMRVDLKYVVGVGGTMITNPAGKSAFVSLDIDDEGASRFVDDPLKKLKFKSAFKLWLKGPGAERDPDRARKLRSLENTGTCPVCFRNIKLKYGEMVDHGFKVPWGYGGRQGNCFGVGKKPFEVSPEGTEQYIKMMHSQIAADEKVVDDLKSGRIEKVPNPRSRDRRRPEMLQLGEEGYDYALKVAVSQVESGIRSLKRTIPDYEKKVADWKAQPLPGTKR